MTYIYTLIDPYTSKVRYVGRTNNLNKRISKHMQRARKWLFLWKTRNKVLVKSGRTMNDIWLSKLLSLDMNPIVNVVEECDIKDALTKERKWIRFYIKKYGSLTNYQLINQKSI